MQAEHCRQEVIIKVLLIVRAPPPIRCQARLTVYRNASKILLLLQYLCQAHDLISLKANAQFLVCAVSSTSNPHCHYGPISSKVPVYGRNVSGTGSSSHVPHSLHSSFDVESGQKPLPTYMSEISLTSFQSTCGYGKADTPCSTITSSTAPESSHAIVIDVLEPD